MAKKPAHMEIEEFVAACTASSDVAFKKFIDSSTEKELYNWLWHPVTESRAKYFEKLYQLAGTIQPKEVTEYQLKVRRIAKLVKENKVEGVILQALCNEAGISPSDIVENTKGETNLPLFYYFMCPVTHDGESKMLVTYNLSVNTNNNGDNGFEEVEIDSNKIEMMKLEDIANEIGNLMISFLKATVSECNEYNFPKNVQLVKIAGMFENAIVAYDIYLEQKENGNEVLGN